MGFPSHLNGLLYNIFLSIDRWLILSLLGLTSLGYYALGMTINEYLFRFSYTFGNVLFEILDIFRRIAMFIQKFLQNRSAMQLHQISPD